MNITAGKYKGQKIIAPDENITRPTLSKVRMSIFNSLQSILNFENATFLDMYSGSGIMGLEALSRGFSKIIMIENNRKAFNTIKSNIKNYEKENDINLIYGDSLKICNPDKISSCDVVYIDPPYFSGIYEKSLELAEKICKEIIILEHVVNIDLNKYDVIKQKKYGDKFITYIKCN